MQNFLARSRFVITVVVSFISMNLLIFCLASGDFNLIQNLIYIPIIIACIYYEKKGFVFSVALALLYLTLTIFITRDFTTLIYAFIRTIMFIIIASVIANLSTAKNK